MDAANCPANHMAELKDIVGDRYVLDGEDNTSPYLRDWSGDYVSSPLCVVLPASTEQVSEVAAYCHAHGVAVIPQGGNTGLVGGCYTTNATSAILLNLKRMTQIRSLNPASYTVEVEAGAIVQTVQDRAADEDRLFPMSFGAQGSAQIGGAIATNAGGLNVLRYGMTRDLVLGLEVVLPDGTIVNGLSSLRKDNRGPDLNQLFIGSEGTLGIITAASLKLFPLPARRETAFLALANEEAALSFFALTRTFCSDLLSAFELIQGQCVDLALDHQSSLRPPLDGQYDTYVLLELTASGPIDLRGLLESLLEEAMTSGQVTDGALAESLGQAQDFWAIREAMVEAQAARGRHLRTDISVPVSEVARFIHAARSQMESCAPDWHAIAYGHVGDGNVHFNLLPPPQLKDEAVREAIPGLLEKIYALLDGFGGSISAEHGIGRSRKHAFQTSSERATVSLIRAMKKLIDPNGIMNPGCLFDAD